VQLVSPQLKHEQQLDHMVVVVVVVAMDQFTIEVVVGVE
jgi:hypothetical protein